MSEEARGPQISDADIEPLRHDLRARRAAELRAFLFATTPIASDLAATLLFYLLFATTGQVGIAVGLGILLGVTQLGWSLWRRQPVPAMQWVSLGLVMVMGGATLITHDPRFVLVKVSLIYLMIGGAMLRSGWLHRYIPPIATRHIPERLVVIAGQMWAGLILGTGVANLILTLTLDAQTVAVIMGLWAPLSKITLSAGQYVVFRQIARSSIRAALASAQ